MPLARYQIRDEYGLADPELYRGADKDDPEALLEGVAMAGLVGVLRQLGDLAEFAAEIFHGLHEEVVATAARGHGLMIRVQQLEGEFPSIEKAFLSQTDQSPYFSNAGVDWHPNLKMDQKLITSGDLPHCVMDSYEECRGPPRLFLLDKFDVAGAGACLKRYTDPSSFRIERTPVEVVATEVQKEKRSRKLKRKGSRWRNGETPERAPTSHVKLHELFLAERIESGQSDPARLVKLKTRKLTGSPLNSKSGRSYMEKFLQNPSPEHKAFSESCLNQQLLTWKTDASGESEAEPSEIMMECAAENLIDGKEARAASPDMEEFILKPSMHTLTREYAARDIETVPEPPVDHRADEIPNTPCKMVEFVSDGKTRTECTLDKNHSEDMTSEVDNYMDALATMESEVETDYECRTRDESRFPNAQNHETDWDLNQEQVVEIPSQCSDSRSIEHTSASEEGYSSFKKESSSFSYSDSVSESTANEPYDVEVVEALPSEYPCVLNKEDASQNNSHEVQSVSGGGADVASIPDLQEASCSLRDTNSGRVVAQQASGVATHYDSDKLGSERIMASKSRVNMADSSLSTVSSKDKFDDGDLNATISRSSSKFLDIADSASGENGCISANGESLKIYHANGSHSENPINAEEGPPQSFLPPEEQFSPSAKSERDLFVSLLVVDPGKEPDYIVHGSGDPVPGSEVSLEGMSLLDTEAHNIPATKEAPQLNPVPPQEPVGENLSTMGTEADETILERPGDTEKDRGSMDPEVSNGVLPLEVSSESQKQITDKLCNYPPVKYNASAAEVLYSEQKASLRMLSRDTDGDEENDLRKHDDLEEYPVSLLLQYSNLDGAIHTDQVSACYVTRKTVHDEDTSNSPRGALSSGDNGKDTRDLRSEQMHLPPKRLPDIQDSISSIDDQRHLGIETKEMFFEKDEPNLQAGKPVNMEVADADVEVMPTKTSSYNSCSREVFKDLEDPYLIKDTDKSPMIGDNLFITQTSLAELTSLGPATKSVVQGNAVVKNDEDVSLAACHLCEPGTPLDQSKRLQVSQSDQAEAGILALKPAIVESEQTQDLDYKVKQKDLDASSESRANGFSFQNPSADVLPNSSFSETQDSKQALNLGPTLPSQELFPKPSQAGMEELPLSMSETRNSKQALNRGPTLPSEELFPKPSQASMEELPPLPPLPPMQWLFGKAQNNSKASKGQSIGTRSILSSCILPSAADSAGGIQNASSDRWTLQPQNPILPLTAAKAVHCPEQFAGSLACLSTLQFPSMLNDSESQPNSIRWEETQSKNPVLSSSAVSNENPKPKYCAEEGSILQSASTLTLSDPCAGHDTLRNDLNSSQKMPLSRLASETTSKADAKVQISQSSAECEKLSVSGSSTSLPSKSVEERSPPVAQSANVEEQDLDVDDFIAKIGIIHSASILSLPQYSAKYATMGEENISSQKMPQSGSAAEMTSKTKATEMVSLISAECENLSSTVSSDSLPQAKVEEQSQTLAQSSKVEGQDELVVSNSLAAEMISKTEATERMPLISANCENLSGSVSSDSLPTTKEEQGQADAQSSKVKGQDELAVSTWFAAGMTSKTEATERISLISAECKNLSAPVSSDLMPTTKKQSQTLSQSSKVEGQDELAGNVVYSAPSSTLTEDAAENATLRQDVISLQKMPLSQLGADTTHKTEGTKRISQDSAALGNLCGTGSSTFSALMKVDQQSQTMAQSSKVEGQKELAAPSQEGGPLLKPASQITLSGSARDALWPVNAFALAPTFEVEKANEIPVVKPPRPRSPLVDAVAAHDRSRMRKASERPNPPVEPKEEERDSLLAQIRNKSFNLKPAVATRPSIQVGPKTNLKVAAILEKANTIRQAMAGSDEDDDSDSWSDS